MSEEDNNKPKNQNVEDIKSFLSKAIEEHKKNPSTKRRKGNAIPREGYTSEDIINTGYYSSETAQTCDNRHFENMIRRGTDDERGL